VVGVCSPFSFIRCPYSNLCQGRRSEYQFQSRNRDLSRGETKGIHTLSWQNIVFLVISGVATGLSWIFYFKALQLGDVTQVAMLDRLSIVLTILLAAIFLGETITLRTAIAAVLIVAGTLLLVVK